MRCSRLCGVSSFWTLTDFWRSALPPDPVWSAAGSEANHNKIQGFASLLLPRRDWRVGGATKLAPISAKPSLKTAATPRRMLFKRTDGSVENTVVDGAMRRIAPMV